MKEHASHRAVVCRRLPALEYILAYFEKLENRAKAGEFRDNPRIQSVITLAWNKAKDYYRKSDRSIAK